LISQQIYFEVELNPTELDLLYAIRS